MIHQGQNTQRDRLATTPFTGQDTWRKVGCCIRQRFEACYCRIQRTWPALAIYHVYGKAVVYPPTNTPRPKAYCTIEYFTRYSIVQHVSGDLSLRQTWSSNLILGFQVSLDDSESGVIISRNKTEIVTVLGNIDHIPPVLRICRQHRVRRQCESDPSLHVFVNMMPWGD